MYAHPNPRSFCHAVLARFTAGLRDAGRTPDLIDLDAIRFDPVFTSRDMATWLHPDMPADVLERMSPRQAVLDGARGPVQRFLARRAMRGKATPSRVTATAGRARFADASGCCTTRRRSSSLRRCSAGRTTRPTGRSR